ncbi:MAG: methylaspartate mutase [Planctomycetes bacterium]|nr:methylaspartate mutase [Planctomycetota bacterium]
MRIVATDCGSTTTKAILIEEIDGVFRQTFRAEAPTTVEEPLADVTIGVTNSVTELQELSGYTLIADDGTVIRRAAGSKGDGCDVYISTSSAGGGLQMMVAGVVREMTAESAKRAALGAGAIVMDTIASNDRRRPHEQIQRIRELRPDMVLISGGTDGGDGKKVVELAELIAPARPRPRFGGEYRLPLIFAGNKAVRGDIERIFSAEGFALSIVDNLRPTLEQENLGPARERIHDVFLEHVMAHAPGYDKLIEWTNAPIMPTPGAVGDILQTIARERKINVVGVDIGGATTDLFSVFGGVFNRTVSANLGMSYSVSNVCAEAGMEQVLRWVHLDMDERELRNRVKNKMIRPTTIPQTHEALVFEQAVAREALRLAYAQHRAFATKLKGVQQQRTVGDTFRQDEGAGSIVDPMLLDLLVASGGVLSHAPRFEQTFLLMIDSFEPTGFTEIAKDSIFMMPHLGVLASINPRAAMEVFERDCLVPLGWCAAPKGDVRIGKPALSFELRGASGMIAQGTLSGGQIRLVRLGVGERATLEVRPERGLDMGAGAGKPVSRTIEGGQVGVLIDARGRPLHFPADHAGRRTMVASWVQAAEVYEGA